MAEDTKKAAAPPAEVKPPSSKGGAITLVLTVLLAGAASFGGAKLGSAAHPPAPVHAAPAHAPTATPPGPTIALEPFIVTMQEPQGPAHVLKLTIAVELKLGKKEEDFKPFVPRVRDATLTYLRSLSYEEAQSGERFEHLRADLLERIQKLGVNVAEQVLITDFVTQ